MARSRSNRHSGSEHTRSPQAGQASRPVGDNVGDKLKARAEMNKGLQILICNPLIVLVGARGFEPPTTCTPCRYATRLRYATKERKYNRQSRQLKLIYLAAF